MPELTGFRNGGRDGLTGMGMVSAALQLSAVYGKKYCNANASPWQS
jgi:hypothetical protein